MCMQMHFAHVRTQVRPRVDAHVHNHADVHSPHTHLHTGAAVTDSPWPAQPYYLSASSHLTGLYLAAAVLALIALDI